MKLASRTLVLSLILLTSFFEIAEAKKFKVKVCDKSYSRSNPLLALSTPNLCGIFDFIDVE